MERANAPCGGHAFLTRRIGQRQVDSSRFADEARREPVLDRTVVDHQTNIYRLTTSLAGLAYGVSQKPSKKPSRRGGFFIHSLQFRTAASAPYWISSDSASNAGRVFTGRGVCWIRNQKRGAWKPSLEIPGHDSSRLWEEGPKRTRFRPSDSVSRPVSLRLT